MFVFLLLIFCFSDVSAQQQRFLNISSRYPYICGSDPYRFYSEFPCYLYPICINGGFQLNVGCSQDYQCTPYSVDAVCVNQCCCTVPKFVGSVQTTTTRRFFDNLSAQSNSLMIIFLAIIFNRVQ
ncbi:unnamed protein product [Caenorhabditis angaria]|uniref:Chitin-binding type-2 domain-containing protein n=1 Tax=Caenorhabditis angaria TaxID=860376 RepID=A0A9P1IQR3_9PELO|nr:unnamed protein product [Caenorhabditis angaria]